MAHSRSFTCFRTNSPRPSLLLSYLLVRRKVNSKNYQQRWWLFSAIMFVYLSKLVSQSIAWNINSNLGMFTLKHCKLGQGHILQEDRNWVQWATFCLLPGIMLKILSQLSLMSLICLFGLLGQLPSVRNIWNNGKVPWLNTKNNRNAFQ